MSAADAADRDPPTPRSRRLLVLLPLIGFGTLAALFIARLGAGDPSLVPSPLIGLPVPSFSLPPLPGRETGLPANLPGRATGLQANLPGRDTGPPVGLDSAALKTGHVTLVNVFASWCAECHDEHGLLMRLAASPRMKSLGIPIDGIVYKDNDDDARRYLGAKGDPYATVGDDRTGRTAIDFGVYGVPETFVIKGDGTIAFKLIGPVTPDNLAALEAEIDKAAK